MSNRSLRGDLTLVPTLRPSLWFAAFSLSVDGQLLLLLLWRWVVVLPLDGGSKVKYVQYICVLSGLSQSRSLPPPWLGHTTLLTEGLAQPLPVEGEVVRPVGEWCGGVGGGEGPVSGWDVCTCVVAVTGLAKISCLTELGWGQPRPAGRTRPRTSPLQGRADLPTHTQPDISPSSSTPSPKSPPVPGGSRSDRVQSGVML